jgi:hypothetical protein
MVPHIPTDDNISINLRALLTSWSHTVCSCIHAQPFAGRAQDLDS